MIVEGNPYVIEYNVRMGDPETEVVLPRISSDFLSHLVDAGRGKLKSSNIDIDLRYATTVMLVSGGYPGKYEKGKTITGLENIRGQIFHAGTRMESGKIATAGGRVIACTSLGTNLNEALESSFQDAETINFEGKYYRKDIGFDLK
jgi:phosphoribosylamine--glycine ligase